MGHEAKTTNHSSYNSFGFVALHVRRSSLLARHIKAMRTPRVMPEMPGAVLPPRDLFGARWHRGAGSKDRMKADAVAMGAESLVELQEPDHGWRNFGCYRTWSDAIGRLRHIDVQRRHLFEVIGHGRECKPYLDLDGPPLPCCGFVTVAEVVELASKLVTTVFRCDYGVELLPDQLVWLESPQADKLSLHLTVSTHGPQWVFSSNHRRDPSGAWNLASRVRQMAPGGFASLVDVTVYSKDREMRTLGAVKHGKPVSSALVPVGSRVGGSGGGGNVLTVAAARDALVTWLDDPSERRRLEVPVPVPVALRPAGPSGGGGAQGGSEFRREDAARQEPEAEQSLVVVRMLDLVREKLHETAFHDRRHGEEAPYDRARGVKFGYTDRGEACYTGVVHDGSQNLRCYVDGSGAVHARCFSERCAGVGAVMLGQLRVESDAHLSGAVRINQRYLAFGTPDSAGGPFEVPVRRWLGGEFRGLSIRSAMGSGKSTFLDAFLSELGPDASVLVVTYRQSLAYEHVRKMRGHGFVSYLDWPSSERPDLSDRAAYPRVICQIESLHLLSEGPCMLPSFDVVVLDESESLLRHFSSTTVPNPMLAMDSFVMVLQQARRGVVTLDAAWGPLTHAVLAKAGLSNVLVVNEWQPDSPRTFAVSNDAARWQAQIVADLAAGLNVVVVSLSAEKAMSVHAAAAMEVGEAACVLHSSKTGDELKRQLADVDALWTKYRAVVYTPTIAAGVDFSSEHFDRMYLYICTMSALPATALQMAFRVRKLRDVRVRCLAAPNVRMSVESSRAALTSVEMMAWLRWMSSSLASGPRMHPPSAEAGSSNAEPGMPRLATLAGQLSATGTRVRLAQRTLDDVWHGSNASSAVQSACLPRVTYWLLMTSFVEAERYNASGNYLRELAALARAAGHHLVIERIAANVSGADVAGEDGADAATLSCVADQLLAAAGRPRATHAEVAAMRLRKHDSLASEPDKWYTFYVAYMAGWGIDRVDQAFIERCGTQPASAKAKLLARILCPSLRRAHDSDVGLVEQNDIFKVVLVQQTVAALGLRSALDDETVVGDLLGVFRDRLSSTEMFREYARTSKLFRIGDGGVRTPWDLGKVVKAVNMVLGAAGLKLAVSVDARKRSEGGRKRVRTYRLDGEAVAEMTELVKMRLRRARRVGGMGQDVTVENEHARTRLDACTMPLFGRLLDDDDDGLLLDDGEM
jgi:hypothetical protein